jgi:hypothetical protein
LYTPHTSVPKHSSQKLCSQIAEAQISAPTTPHSVPLISPRWRPTRFMWSDAGMVPIAPPSTQQVTGRVARPM